MTQFVDDDRYCWLNDLICAVSGAAEPRPDGRGFDVVMDVSEIVWEPRAERA